MTTIEHLKISPHDPDSERAVLSCLLRDPDRLFPESRDVLHQGHFFSASHALIFKTMQSLQVQGKADLMLLLAELRRTDDLEKVGGPGALAALVDDVPTTAMFSGYVEILRDLCSRREAISELERAIRDLYDLQNDAIGSLTSLAEFANRAVESQVVHDSTQAIRDVVLEATQKIEEAYDRGGMLPGVSTGIEQLDGRTGGLKEGEFMVVKAFPGVGKTAFGFQILRHICREGVPALGMSAEMLAYALGIRLLASEGTIDGLALERGQLDRDMMHRMGQAGSRLSDMPLWIDDRSGMTISAVEAVTSRMVRSHSIRVVLVDYIQLIQPSGNYRTRQEAVAAMSASLKSLAKRHKITVIGLSQCNSEGRSREAADIEQDADIVLHLKRDEKEENRHKETGTELIDRPIIGVLEKARGGNPGTWDMNFHGPTTTFEMNDKPKGQTDE